MLVLVAAVASGACSLRGSEYQFVRNRGTGTYLRLPEAWKVAKIPDAEEIEFGRVFDSSEIENDQLIVSSTRPNGFVQVRTLSPSESDVVSFELLRNAVFDVDQGIAAGTVELTRYDRVDQGDFRGQRMVFRTVGEEGEATIAQVALLDPNTTRVHLLVVGCLSSCYEEHQGQIDAVIESFTVKET